jgi:allophanate hydrolase
MHASTAIGDRAGWTLADWQQAYRQPGTTPAEMLSAYVEESEPDNAWIFRVTEALLHDQMEALDRRLAAVQGNLDQLPLYGVPFAVKDNIDAADWPTTAACPAFSYAAAKDATVVRRLRAAGAILVGKTNLDQFATGLVGTRSPHGAVANTFDPRYISGGSSSGSASLVARGIVAFSLGTDTAGSGRVPAGFNNIVGLKPTKGWLSTAGVVPACRTQDCVSVFALTVNDAQAIATIAGGFDAADAYSRVRPDTPSRPWGPVPRIAIPNALEFFGDTVAEAAFTDAVDALRAMGAQLEPIDFAPFDALAALLYQGPWVAERFAAVEALWKVSPDAIHPVVRSIVEQAANYSAVDAFNAEYRRADLARTIQGILAGFDALVVPTSPSIYTIDALHNDPITLNSRLGIYTNFANLADLSALALPAGFRSDGLPAGITMIGLAWQDDALAAFGRQWQAERRLPLGATGRPFSESPIAVPAEREHHVRLAVVGAHLTGMPLNRQLTERNAIFVEKTHTGDNYRLYALAATQPPKPGLVQGHEGASIEVELWDVPLAAFGSFVTEIPGPLGIGTLSLADGRQVKGFICEPRGIEGARDITAFGGWRAYLASLSRTAT